MELPVQPQQDNSNQQKNPKDWVTGDEPMTGAQASYLKTLSEESNETFDDSLSKGEASKRIDALRQRSARLHPEGGEEQQSNTGDA